MSIGLKIDFHLHLVVNTSKSYHRYNIKIMSTGLKIDFQLDVKLMSQIITDIK